MFSMKKPSLVGVGYALTFFLGTHGYISWRLRVMSLKSTRNLKHFPRSNLPNLLNVCNQKMLESMWEKHLKITYLIMVPHTFTEKQFGQLVKCMQLENGGEYVRKTFEYYLYHNGISRKWFIPHTPQHNDIVERKNRTLVKMACCLLQAKSVPTSFLVEAIYCSNYLMNLVSTKVVYDMTRRKK